MERLTERDAYWIGEEFWTSAREPDDEEIDAVYEKLKSYEDKQEQGLLIEKAELDKYKLALFGVIRNSKVMPVGIQQGRSMEEINAMSLKTLEEVMVLCDFETLGRYYSEAEEALARMEGE